ncbi:HNH endonuclease [Roseomonas chloroacetimidivorans]|uniref:HNH endonuclease n=1 Tax=Roseomonas chloroacetimidivorans TaxID=1766656 RepID=UPI003C7628D8
MARYQANPERAKASVAAWQKANPEKYRKTQREIHARHRDRYNASNGANYHAKKATINAERRKRWAVDQEYRLQRLTREHHAYRQNRDEKLAYAKQYRASKAASIRAGQVTRRARENGASGKITEADWTGILAYFGNRCAYCLRHADEGVELTADHMLPLSRGGSNDPSNVVPACRSCNCTKRTRTPLEFLAGLSAPPRCRNPLEEPMAHV